eukprot:TRINITY_DN6262_c0_g1_i1.p1 TRINITY_DN6262_c0_g1~~TRINITY_DN6262_c0_g1_i1.p1  ORF type:complete len:411 (-),score=68.11 TRINITY_DN6262_c0_g1_i1:58-1290(-)
MALWSCCLDKPDCEADMLMMPISCCYSAHPLEPLEGVHSNCTLLNSLENPLVESCVEAEDSFAKHGGVSEGIPTRPETDEQEPYGLQLRHRSGTSSFEEIPIDSRQDSSECKRSQLAPDLHAILQSQQELQLDLMPGSNRPDACLYTEKMPGDDDDDDDEERWGHCFSLSKIQATDAVVDRVSTGLPVEDIDDDEQVCDLHGSDWWAAVDLETGSPAWHGLAQMAKLCSVRIIDHSAPSCPEALAPWLPRCSEALHQSMGAVDSNCSYLAVWLKMHGTSLVVVSALPADAATSIISKPDLVHGRLKLSINPVGSCSSLPDKHPRDVETVGALFGESATHTSIYHTATGVTTAYIQIDMYANWMFRLALKQDVLRLGNIFGIILTDWPSQTILASAQLTVSECFLQCIQHQ